MELLINKHLFERIVLPIVVVVLVFVGIFYFILVKYIISPIEEITPEMVNEMRTQRQLEAIEAARQEVQKQYLLTKSPEEQFSDLEKKRQATNPKPLSEGEKDSQLQTLDNLRNR